MQGASLWYQSLRVCFFLFFKKKWQAILVFFKRNKYVKNSFCTVLQLVNKSFRAHLDTKFMRICIHDHRRSQKLMFAQLIHWKRSDLKMHNIMSFRIHIGCEMLVYLGHAFLNLRISHIHEILSTLERWIPHWEKLVGEDFGCIHVELVSIHKCSLGRISWYLLDR